MNTYEKVRVWKDTLTIPTYQVGKAEKNPMFLENRVYQGSTGKVYPNRVIDKITDRIVDEEYTVLYLENQFIKVMILPCYGGRIQRATDKSNDYDFVYYNSVIKPALVGLTGPWISGGIEFNWPQHHRPTTFEPVNYTYNENEDDSASIVVGEIENMFRTKSLVEFKLYPDRTYIEINAQVFNRTDLPQTFLWWANPAVPANDYQRSIFPPDVTTVTDHGKRATSTFPIATGVYYNVDYSAGVDISRYKNLPVPTSYMAAKSDYDFIGSYDDNIRAGILHVADHHVSPGKKQWTWGCGDFGKAWDRSLTDNDGPYIELMTGCYTDNQPDFTWIAPMEEKRFTQYFMPYKKLGTVHNATKDLAMNFEKGLINLFATGNVGKFTVKAFHNNVEVLSETLTMNPTDFHSIKADHTSISRIVFLRNGIEYLEFYPNGKKQERANPATPAPQPKDCKTTEDLFLYGMHIEQYRHATYRPKDYYKEGLRRDPTDVRLNNAYGLLLLRQGFFQESEKHFQKAIDKITRSNPNPYDSEPYYNLGLALQYQNKLSDSYTAFYKSAWSSASQEAAFYHLACIAAKRLDFGLALQHIENAIIKNGRNYRALNLKALLLQATGQEAKAKELAVQIGTYDKLDIISKRILSEIPKMHHNTAIEIALEYARAGFNDDAVKVLEEDKSGYPMVYYHLAYFYHLLENTEKTQQTLKKAMNGDSYLCFPHRLEDMQVLTWASEENKKDGMAHYYLGCLLYDKKRYNEAMDCFEKCTKLAPKFPTSYRNLAIAYFNKKDDAKKATQMMEKAFELDTGDSRILMELDQLYQKQGKTPVERIKTFEKYSELIDERDDLYVAYMGLLNMLGDDEKAYDYVMARSFHPWEGGEGQVPEQYIFSLISMAIRAMDRGENDVAVSLLLKTLVYPHSFGEGKLHTAQENLQNYMLGVVYEKLEKKDKATLYFEKASTGLTEPNMACYYHDQPPQTIYCQGLALDKLCRHDEARHRYEKLLAFASENIDKKAEVDYFAVSLPEFRVFDENQNLNKRVHCLFMRALGELGLNKKQEALATFEEAEKLDPNHFARNRYKHFFVESTF